MAGLMAAFGLSLLLPFAARAEDWPQWRGPNRGTKPASWSPFRRAARRFPGGHRWDRAGPVPSWHKAGFMSPTVQTAGHTARERVLCFDEATLIEDGLVTA